MRQHLEQRIRQGGPRGEEAQLRLDGPPVPDVMQYLYGWMNEVTGRSGVGMEGIAPLSYQTIESWAKLTGRSPLPYEIHALMKLDRIIRHPDIVDPEDGEDS